ncbi:MAG: YitT family protein [Pseudoflavonifractor sp.]|nr:YitT family protein [Alloprevotella sp.]MCM1116017.1 YitT family protein [Pseudoflavonifractor sp.]
MNPKSKAKWASTRDYLMIVLGIMMYAFGFTAFIFPEKIVIGGLAGFGTVIYFLTERFMGYGVPVAITSYACNLLLLGMAFRSVGRQFVWRTIFGATVLSLGIGLLQPLFPAPLIEGETFMSAIIGAILMGFGIGLVFVHNGSSGGTDIIAAMVAKKSNVTIGRIMLYVDMCIISSSFLLFGQLDKVVYGFVVLVIMSYVCDMVILTNRQAVQFTIISRHWDEIAAAINNDAHRGCTVIDGTGWYTRQSVKILLVFCRKIEAVTIFRIIKSIDPDAFISQGNVNGVYGRGFDAIKVKVKPSEHQEQTRLTSAPPAPSTGANVQI